ncbi:MULTISPECIES: hypothetical protein [Micromonospora]|uniref:hypothetical protein n=1 Tax=Micromonospora TaxID=1873 RepID=UPI0030160E31
MTARCAADRGRVRLLSAWTRIYGLVAMEVSDHLAWAVDEPEALFETELVGLLAQLRPANPSPRAAARH